MNKIRSVLATSLSLFVCAAMVFASNDGTTPTGGTLTSGYILSMSGFDQGILISRTSAENYTTWYSKGKEVFTTMIDQEDGKQKVTDRTFYKADGTIDYKVDAEGNKTYFDKNQPSYTMNSDGFKTMEWTYSNGFLAKTTEYGKEVAEDGSSTTTVVSETSYANGKVVSVTGTKAATYTYDSKGDIRSITSPEGDTTYYQGGRAQYTTNSSGAKISQNFYKNGVLDHSYTYGSASGDVTSTTLYDYHGRAKYTVNGDFFTSDLATKVGNFFANLKDNVVTGLKNLLSGATTVAGAAKDAIVSAFNAIIKSAYVYTDESTADMMGFGATKNADGSVSAHYEATMYNDKGEATLISKDVTHGFGTCMGVVGYSLDLNNNNYVSKRTVIDDGKELFTIGYDAPAPENINLTSNDVNTSWTDPAIKGGVISQVSVADYLSKTGVDLSTLGEEEKTAILKDLGKKFMGDESALLGKSLSDVMVNIVSGGDIDHFDNGGYVNNDKIYILGLKGSYSDNFVGKDVFLSGGEAASNFTGTITTGTETRARSSGNVVSSDTTSRNIDFSINYFRVDMSQIM